MKKICLTPWIGLLVLLLSAHAHAEWYRDQQSIMGTRISAEIWHEDARKAQSGLDAVFSEMRRIDREMSPYIDSSQLSQLNKHAAMQAFPISEEMFRLIQRSLLISQMSEGAFDVTFASVGHLYNYRNGTLPRQRDIDASLPAIDYHHLQLDEKNFSIHYRHPGVRVDLGGIAKGHAVDNCIHILLGMGFQHAIVTAGGDSRIIGDKLGRPWMIGIQEPRQQNRSAVVLPLVDSAISTSGDYERYFIRDGVRHHHIISPATGKSVKEVRSVSVIGPDATTTDALSTTVFVMGMQRGMALIESLPGIEAVIIDQKGKLFYSSGLSKPAKPGSGK